jgi:hypothetical protein
MSLKLPKHDPYPLLAWCGICGWRKGGQDPWDGKACKCGFVFTERVQSEKLNKDEA